MTIRSVSYGGGVQSTALLVLAADGLIDYPTFLFANVGDDSEHPDTLRYVHEVAMPYAAEHGIALHELRRTRKDKTPDTVHGRAIGQAGRPPRPVIPMRLANGKPGKRACTEDFKVKVIAKWLKTAGATPATPAIVGIGISVDEIHRANGRSDHAYVQIEYPLLLAGLTRNECHRIIGAAGLPIPRKSSCFFCPFHSAETWRTLAREEPDLFAQSVNIERTGNLQLAKRGKRLVYMTDSGRPLDETVTADQGTLDFGSASDGSCDSGHCFT